MNATGSSQAIPDCRNLAFSGSWAAQLKDACLIESDDCSVVLVARKTSLWFQIPSLRADLQCAKVVSLERLRRIGGGDYGYSLGYMENGHYRSPRSLGRAHLFFCRTCLRRSWTVIAVPIMLVMVKTVCSRTVIMSSFMALPMAKIPIFINDQGIVAPGMAVRSTV